MRWAECVASPNIHVPGTLDLACIRLVGMIREIRPTEVRSWAVRASARMAHVRCQAGLVDKALARQLESRQLRRFTAGLPRGARVFLDEAGHWLWYMPGKICAVDIDDPAEWAELTHRLAAAEVPVGSRASGGVVQREGLAGSAGVAVATAPGGELQFSRFRGDAASTALAGAVDARLKSMELVAQLPAITWHEHHSSTVSLRAMSSVDLYDFLRVTAEELAAQQEATHPGTSHRELAVRARARADRKLPDGVSTPGHLLLSIVADGRVAGGLWAETDGGRVRIWNLLVYPEFQGRGMTRAALSALSSSLILEGITFMSVPLVATNTHAEQIFTSAGFVRARESYAVR